MSSHNMDEIALNGKDKKKHIWIAWVLVFVVALLVFNIRYKYQLDKCTELNDSLWIKNVIHNSLDEQYLGSTLLKAGIDVNKYQEGIPEKGIIFVIPYRSSDKCLEKILQYFDRLQTIKKNIRYQFINYPKNIYNSIINSYQISNYSQLDTNNVAYTRNDLIQGKMGIFALSFENLRIIGTLYLGEYSSTKIINLANSIYW